MCPPRVCFLPAAQCFTLCILQFYLPFLLVMGTSQVASHSSHHRQCWDEITRIVPSRSAWEFLGDKLRSRIACQRNTYRLSDKVLQLHSLEWLQQFTLLPATCKGSFIIHLTSFPCLPTLGFILIFGFMHLYLPF